MASRIRLSVDAHALLSCIPLFTGIRTDSLARLAGACRIIELPRRRSLFGAGQPIRESYFLVSGLIKRFARISDGTEKVLERVGPGQLFALSETFCCDCFSSHAETLEASVIVAITIEPLREVVANEAALAMRLLQTMARTQHVAEFDEIRHRSRSVPQRVLHYLLGLAEGKRTLVGETTVRLGASKQLIAAELEMAPETFSRALRRLSEDGVIVVVGRSVHIQNATLSIVEREGGVAATPSQLYPRLERGTNQNRVSPTALVNLCGRHRMLSQRMATAWIMIARKFSEDAARVELRKYLLGFQRNFDRVVALQLPEGVHQHAAVLEREWLSFKETLATEPNQQSAADVFQQSEQVLQAADQLTAAAVTSAKSVEAHWVNIAGRNRMLCARAIKVFLYYDWGVDATVAKQLQEACRQEFLRNIDSLIGSTANYPAFQEQLHVALSQWHHFLDVIACAEGYPTLTAHALEVLAANDELLRHADTTVKLCERFSVKQEETQGFMYKTAESDLSLCFY